MSDPNHPLGPNNRADHGEAMALIIGAAGVTTLSYEEAIAIYLRARGILADGAQALGSAIPSTWVPA